MTEVNQKASRLRNAFEKVADKKLQPDNFGSFLMTAATERLATKTQIAGFLGVDVEHIRKAGNSLKGREMAHVSRQIVDAYDRQHA